MANSAVGERWVACAPYLQSVLRIAAAFMFILAGTMKLFAFPGAMPGGATAHFPSQIWFGGVLEAFGGLLMLLGLFTRPRLPVASLLNKSLLPAARVQAPRPRPGGRKEQPDEAIQRCRRAVVDGGPEARGKVELEGGDRHLAREH